MTNPLIDITGKRFGKLVAIGLASKTKCGRVRWLFRCDCGGQRIDQANHLTDRRLTQRGPIGCRSCKPSRIAKFLFKHGESSSNNQKITRLYSMWVAMLQRCSNETDKRFKWYGAKGIVVCNEWLAFEKFRDWALTHGYKDTLTIERVNPKWNYEPSNCEFIPKAENTRRSALRQKYWRSMTADMVRVVYEV